MNRPSQGNGAGAWRAKFRQRQHDAAHAAEPLPDTEIPDRPDIPRGPATVVADQPALDALVASLHTAGVFAYDTEFVGEMTYTPRLCLVQVATAESVWLIDPLAKVDLIGFWKLLADPSVVKVLHAGEQDLEPVVRLLGEPARNIFDTQIAAGFCRLPYPLALTKLVGEIAGVKLGKGLTFTHWDQRPLSAMQLRYAADDVRYLIAVYHSLRDDLEASGRLAWATAEFDRLCSVGHHTFDAIDQADRIRGSATLAPRNLAVLRELCAWRDAAAREQDLPVRVYLKDEALIDLARSPAREVQKLDRVRALTRRIIQEQGDQIVRRTAAAVALPPDQLPPPPAAEPAPRERFHAECVWSIAQATAAGLGIDPALVLSRADAIELSRKLVSGEDPAGCRLTTGWRGDAVGRVVLDVLAGRSSLTLESSDSLLTARTTPSAG